MIGSGIGQMTDATKRDIVTGNPNRRLFVDASGKH